MSPSSLINNLKVGMPFSGVSHLFTKNMIVVIPFSGVSHLFTKIMIVVIPFSPPPL
jgi:hypothetical protein